MNRKYMLLPVLSACTLALGCRDKVDRSEALPTVDNIADEPNQFYGKVVSVSGEVDTVFGPTAFELEDQMDVIFDDQILVVTKKPVRFGSTGLSDDDFVLVTGTVRKYVRAEFEKEFSWDEGFSTVLDEWNEKPVLVASSVRKMTEYGRWSERDEPQGVRIGWTATLLEPEPATLVGEPISLESVQVVSKSGRGLWLGSRLFPVLAVQRPDQGVFEAKDWVDVRGTIRRLPETPTAISAWGLDADARERLEDAAYYIDVDKIEKTQELPSRIKSAVDFKTYAKSVSDHEDQLVEGEATVTKVISDRGFYLKNPSGGDDIFAVVREDIPSHEMIDIDAGDRLKFEAWSESKESQVAGALEADAKQAIEKSPGFLTMYWRNVDVLEGT